MPGSPATGLGVIPFSIPIELTESDEQANVIAATQIAPPKRTAISKFPD
jgi:hypothetical protein